jgi:hypothetical protein
MLETDWFRGPRNSPASCATGDFPASCATGDFPASCATGDFMVQSGSVLDIGEFPRSFSDFRHLAI